MFNINAHLYRLISQACRTVKAEILETCSEGNYHAVPIGPLLFLAAQKRGDKETIFRLGTDLISLLILLLLLLLLLLLFKTA